MPTAEGLSEALLRQMLAVALEEARHGMAQGGIPIGAALFHEDGTLLGRGHNRRVQDGDPSMHAETAAFRAAGRRRHYQDCVMVTTLSPCWYCSGLLRQFGIGTVVVGEAHNFVGGHDWVADTAAGSCCSTMPSASTCWPATSRPTATSGTRTSDCDDLVGRPEETIARIAQARDDVADLVELRIDGGAEHRHRRVRAARRWPARAPRR